MSFCLLSTCFIFIFQVIRICPFYGNSMFFVASFSVGGFLGCYSSLTLLLTNWTHDCFSFVKQSLLKHQALSGYILFASKKDDPSKSTPTRTTAHIQLCGQFPLVSKIKSNLKLLLLGYRIICTTK